MESEAIEEIENNLEDSSNFDERLEEGGCEEETDGLSELLGPVSVPPPFFDNMVPPSSSSDQTLMEALLMSKALFKRSNSIDSTISSVMSENDCPCDDCILGLNDPVEFKYINEAGETLQRHLKKRKKPSGWRKVRNVVQWTPFIQTYKNRKYQWVQLAGHSGNFKAGKYQGTVLKKLCMQESQCYEKFLTDSIKEFVPEFRGMLTLADDEKFIQLEDCLSSFKSPSIMDCKIGVRTYLEEELAKAKEKPKLRKDMYEKMIAVDPHAPTEEEHRLKGVTKPRYMVWRETISSTATLGFRIEGVKKSDGSSKKDFKTTKTREQVSEAFRNFTAGSSETAKQYLERLKKIRRALDESMFFKAHELIGSSLLFVHDAFKAGVWLIDFGKTVRIPESLTIDHKSPWEVGNHEDGYLIGIDNLIDIFSNLYPDKTNSLAVEFSEISIDSERGKEEPH